MNVVIVAGGNGTRFGELSIFPKLLLPCTNHSSILHSHLNMFGNCEYYVIIHNKFYDMFSNYCNVNGLNNIHIIKSTNCNGSYNTIMNVGSELPTNDVLFVWSDIIINKIDLSKIHGNTIFTYDGDYRFSIDNGAITNCGNNGNIPGVYYFSRFDVEPIKEQETDFIEYINDKIQDGIVFDTMSIDNLVEYRDYETYINLYRNCVNESVKPRFFNKITIKDNILTKQCISDKYKSLIEKEIEWYNLFPAKEFIPHIYSTNSDMGVINMEYLSDYIPLYQYIKTSKDNTCINKIYTNLYNIITNMAMISKRVSFEQFATDLHKEVVEKTMMRCENISSMLINYSTNETKSLLEKAYDYIITNTVDEITYTFGHGDMNGANVLVNPNTFDIKLIDARGYFGNSNMWMWHEYEVAKILYCLSGYDDFNNEAKIYKIDEPISFDIINVVNKIFSFNKTDYILLYVIWIALAGYISQDILKANISYEYGLKKLKELV